MMNSFNKRVFRLGGSPSVSHWFFILFMALFLGAILGGCDKKQGQTGKESIQLKRYEFKTKGPYAPAPTIVLEYPVYTGPQGKELLSKINSVIGPEGVFGQTAEELSKIIAEEAIPFDSARAEVIYHGKGLLEVLWTITATGAYTGSSRINVIADLEKGITHGPESMFEYDYKMASFVHARIEPELQKRIDELYQKHPDVKETLTNMGIPLPYGPDDLFNLQLGDKGIHFVYSFKFPQSYASIEPEPMRVFIPWEEIKPFMYEGCILERFVRK